MRTSEATLAIGSGCPLKPSGTVATNYLAASVGISSTGSGSLNKTREQLLESRLFGRFFRQPLNPLQRQDHGHSIVDLSAQLVRRRGNDRETPYRLLGRRTPSLP